MLVDLWFIWRTKKLYSTLKNVASSAMFCATYFQFLSEKKIHFYFLVQVSDAECRTMINRKGSVLIFELIKFREDLIFVRRFSAGMLNFRWLKITRLEMADSDSISIKMWRLNCTLKRLFLPTLLEVVLLSTWSAVDLALGWRSGFAVWLNPHYV